MSVIPHDPLTVLYDELAPVSWYPRRRRRIDEIVVHRIALYEDEARTIEKPPTAKSIEDYHRAHPEVSGGHNPYAELITPSQVQLLIPLDRYGHHATRPFNARSYAIAMWGNFRRHRGEPTEWQFEQLVERCAVVAIAARIEFGHWPKVKGHTELPRDWKGHVCPGENVNMVAIRRRVAQRLVEKREEQRRLIA